jgi:hypothetical protein
MKTMPSFCIHHSSFIVHRSAFIQLSAKKDFRRGGSCPPPEVRHGSKAAELCRQTRNDLAVACLLGRLDAR